jgi:putative cardiolipin synthase
MNLDPRSRALNSEVALRIDSPALGVQMTGLFDEATTLEEAFRVSLEAPGDAGAALRWDGIDGDRPRRHTREPLASAWRRWLVRFLGGWTPESLL